MQIEHSVGMQISTMKLLGYEKDFGDERYNLK